MNDGSFQERLVRCMRAGNLTVADLSTWFGRPYQTVRWWVYAHPDGKTRAPWGPFREEMLRRLKTLEAFTRHNKSSFAMGPHERRAWIRRVSDERNGKVPKTHSAT